MKLLKIFCCKTVKVLRTLENKIQSIHDLLFIQLWKKNVFIPFLLMLLAASKMRYPERHWQMVN